MKKIFLIISGQCVSLYVRFHCVCCCGKIAKLSGEVSWRDKANVPYKKPRKAWILKQDTG